MQMVRITAAYVADGRLDPVYKYVFMCGQLPDGSIAPRHEWFGFSLEGKVRFPFTLSEEGEIDYGWHENQKGSTTLRQIRPQPGATFSVTHAAESPGGTPCVDTYQITHCVAYEVASLATA